VRHPCRVGGPTWGALVCSLVPFLSGEEQGPMRRAAPSRRGGGAADIEPERGGRNGGRRSVPCQEGEDHVCPSPSSDGRARRR
jgi:hypothetical protein